MMVPIKILVVDDHAFIRKGIIQILKDNGMSSNIIEANNGKDALQVILEQIPEIVLIDISLPKMSGIEVIRRTYESGISPFRIRFLVISMHDSPEYYYRVITAGAKGMISKESGPEILIKAICEIYNGGIFFGQSIDERSIQTIVNKFNRMDFESHDPDMVNLTKREEDVVSLLYKGLQNKDIAAKLGLSERTVETHRQSLMNKLGVRNIIELSIVVNTSEKLRHLISKSILEFLDESEDHCRLQC